MDRLLGSPSFWTLDSEGQAAIRAYADPNGQCAEWDVTAIYQNRKTLADSLTDVEQQLEEINPASFAFLSSAQKKALEGDLLLMFYQLSAQYKLDWVEREYHLLDSRGNQLKACAKLIDQLRESSGEWTTPEAQLRYQINSSNHYTNYLGLRLITPVLAEGIEAMMSGQKAQADSFIGLINERRLYWVWGGSMIRALLDLLPGYIANKSTAVSMLDFIAPISGSLSWILYFTRAGLEWSALISHTVPTAMGAEERALKLSWRERFKTQWAMRKYNLLNDSIWGVCNLLCFFILVGSGMLGYWGNVVTAALLVMDLTLTYWRKGEEEAEYYAKLQCYQTEKEQLHQAIQRILALDVASRDVEQLAKLQASIRRVDKKIHETKFNWVYQHRATHYDLIYSVALLAAFSLMCAMFFPPMAVAPAAALILGVVGICLCFTFNLIYASATMGLGISKAQALSTTSEKALINEVTLFLARRDELNQSSTPEVRQQLENQMKQHYLMILELKANTRYQQLVMAHQRIQFWVSTFRDAFIPPLFILSMVFMPLGVGIPMLVVGVVLALAAYAWLRQIEPQKPSLPTFDDCAYQRFCMQGANKDTNDVLAFLKDEMPIKTSEWSVFSPLSLTKTPTEIASSVPPFVSLPKMSEQ